MTGSIKSRLAAVERRAALHGALVAEVEGLLLELLEQPLEEEERSMFETLTKPQGMTAEEDARFWAWLEEGMR